MNINYVVGHATNPEGTSWRIIVHVCNDIGAWGRGFVLALFSKWKLPEQQYRAWTRGEVDLPFELGQVQFVEVADGLWVANLLGQHDIRRHSGMPPVRYETIRQGLQRVAEQATQQGASVHMPRIEAGLAGGNWNTISEIVHDELSAKSIPVTVDDLPSKAQP
jgi:O-acetyl-ADP-ribose deacetylase (regulator of RNase III)